jgi:phosphonate transport system substrate-binding protein
MSPNEDTIFRVAVAAAEGLGHTVTVVDADPWEERRRLLDAGQVDVAWLCGLPYARMADEPQPRIELLAAPVMTGERYGDKPVYFSEVVVRAASDFRTFEDLRGAAFGYNETGSHSGYMVMKYHLADGDYGDRFFGEVVETGSHLASLEMVLREELDTACIDVMVLDLAKKQRPELDTELRVVATLGPSPAPPLVALTALPEEVRRELRAALTGLDGTAEGKSILRRGGLVRFAAVADSDYDEIRRMAALAETIRL